MQTKLQSKISIRCLDSGFYLRRIPIYFERLISLFVPRSPFKPAVITVILLGPNGIRAPLWYSRVSRWIITRLPNNQRTVLLSLFLSSSLLYIGRDNSKISSSWLCDRHHCGIHQIFLWLCKLLSFVVDESIAVYIRIYTYFSTYDRAQGFSHQYCIIKYNLAARNYDFINGKRNDMVLFIGRFDFTYMRIAHVDVNNAHACIKRAYKSRLRIRIPAQSSCICLRSSTWQWRW